MLSDEDLQREVERFRAAEEQVRRDHAISHLLAALSGRIYEDINFFGGTALGRTQLVAGRLSEDIDLIARGPRGEVVDKIRVAIGEGLLRSHGRVTWNHDFGLRDVEPTVLTTPDGISIRVQVLRKLIYANWPVQLTKIDLRYSDVRPAGLCVPTIESFVA